MTRAKNSATIEWPLGPSGEPFPIEGSIHQALAFQHGAHVATAKDFVRFLVAEGWLMHYLDFSGERMLPSIPKLLDQPFWLDPSDPHRMAAVMQIQLAPDGSRLRRSLRRPAARPDYKRAGCGGRRSIASPPRAPAPRRRSTKPSPVPRRS